MIVGCINPIDGRFYQQPVWDTLRKMKLETVKISGTDPSRMVERKPGEEVLRLSTNIFILTRISRTGDRSTHRKKH